MFVGSMASALHGPPRSTQDIDLVIALGRADIARLVAAFPEDRYYISAEAVRDAVLRRGPFNVIDLESGWKADLMVRKDRPFSVAELGRRQHAEILGVSTWVATPEDTILSKLEWSALGGGSARQLDDVRGILATQGGTLDLAYLDHWAGALGVLDVWKALQAQSG
ncbi:MAG: hypothetical protein U1F43_27990 [Myxococcota bacterium]